MTVISLILLLVILPAVIGYCLYTEYTAEGLGHDALHIWNHHLRRAFHQGLEPGDFVIYRKSKASTRPGPRARNVQAAENGDDYYYEVDKYWALSEVLEDGRVMAVTRTGKQIYLPSEDKRLRKAGLIERFRHRGRFPSQS
ncbi:MAG TPA: hypothetical protein VHY22_07390 [Chthoniobacteraceae bacterium]|jgi:hypothetical protein|nr:hypothetical protein [Chthoniobacteraceae bacterium]